MKSKYNNGQVLCSKCHDFKELEIINQDETERTRKYYCKRCKIEFIKNLSDDSSVMINL